MGLGREVDEVDVIRGVDDIGGFGADEDDGAGSNLARVVLPVAEAGFIDTVVKFDVVFGARCPFRLGAVAGIARLPLNLK